MPKNVADSPIFRRRQRRKDHFHQLDKTLVFAYPNLSDGAKLTYIVLDAYDWPDSTGESKGYVFPYQSTLAKVRGCTVRTIQRHLDELMISELITVETFTTANGKRNVYWIEDASDEEFQRYLDLMSKPKLDGGDDKNVVTHRDKNVVTGDDKNVVYKDNKLKDNEEEGLDKTSGQVQSLSVDEITVTTGESVVPDEKAAARVEAVFAEIMNRKPTTTERAHLKRLLTKYDPNDVETALFELMVQRDQRHVKNPSRYLEGILDTWQREGRRTTDIVEHLRKLSGQAG